MRVILLSFDCKREKLRKSVANYVHSPLKITCDLSADPSVAHLTNHGLTAGICHVDQLETDSWICHVDQLETDSWICHVSQGTS